MTVAFGALSLFQFIRDYGEGRAWRERRKNLIAIKNGLEQMRAALTEAGQTEEVIKTDAARQFVRMLGHQVRAIEHHIDGMLETDAENDRGRRPAPPTAVPPPIAAPPPSP